jgi:hypothetical protein
MGKLKRPENFADLTPEQLSEWNAKVIAAANELAAKSGDFSDDDLAYSAELIAWATESTDALAALPAAPAAPTADATRAALAALKAPEPAADGGDGDDGGDGEPEPDGDGSTVANAAVLSSVESILNAVADRIKSETPAAPEPPSGGGGGAAPSVADLAGAGVGTGAPEPEPVGPVMVAAADFGDYGKGQPLANRTELMGALAGRIANYASPTSERGPVLKTPVDLKAAAIMKPLPGGGFAPSGQMQLLSGGHQRHGVARIERASAGRREFHPRDEHLNREIAQEASDEWVAQLRQGRTAAVGGTARDTLIAAWCAPEESLYGLCEQWSLDGRLALPTRTVPRGSIQFAQGYDFSDIYTLVGDNTATCAELEAGVTKTCVEVPCLDADTVCLNVDWLCITADILQRRAWNESVESFISGALAVKMHKTNSRIIAQIAAASGAATVLASCDADDAFSSFLSGLEVAKTDMGYNQYMSLSGEWEAIVPAWVLPQLRAAVMRRRAIEDPVKADSWMQAQFAKINYTVHFVYGYQDAHVVTPATGLPGGPTPLAALPTETDFIVYPAGTWVLGELPVIELDTIYDSTGLQSNSYTALFVEDGWSAMQMCALSRQYTVTLDPCGCGCAAGATS